MKLPFSRLFTGLLWMLAGVLPSISVAGQALTQASYNLDFLAGRYEETSHDIVLVFRYAPRHGQEFKPIFSQRFAYSLGTDGAEQQVQFGAPSRHSIAAYGPDLRSKNPALYQWLKNRMDFNSKQDFLLAVFYLRGLADRYYPNMTYTYGFWAPKNTEIRFERHYQVALEHR